MAAKDNSPVSLQAFSLRMAACGPFESKPHLAVALSGGADSMALLLLAQQWVSQRSGSITALTVDHGLRAESSEEAAYLSGWCSQRGIPHMILRWRHGIVTSAIQEQAREARYTLLTDYCRDNHILHLLTGHHAGDQAETVLLRILSGSGIAGLAGMPLITEHQVRLLRPLLDIPKDRLIATLEAFGENWLEDPSNQSKYYTRNALRSFCGSDISNRLLAISSNSASWRSGWEKRLGSQLSDCVEFNPAGFAFLHIQPQYTQAALSPLLAALFPALSNHSLPPRGQEMAQLAEHMLHAYTGRTLGGLHFMPYRQHTWLVMREQVRLPKAVAVKPGEWVYWGAHGCLIDTSAAKGMTFRALGAKGIQLLRKRKLLPKMNGMLRQAYAASPALWQLDELRIAPYIPYIAESFTGIRAQWRLRPVKALAGGAFCAMSNTIRTET